LNVTEAIEDLARMSISYDKARAPPDMKVLSDVQSNNVQTGAWNVVGAGTTIGTTPNLMKPVTFVPESGPTVLQKPDTTAFGSVGQTSQEQKANATYKDSDMKTIFRDPNLTSLQFINGLMKKHPVVHDAPTQEYQPSSPVSSVGSNERLTFASGLLDTKEEPLCKELRVAPQLGTNQEPFLGSNQNPFNLESFTDNSGIILKNLKNTPALINIFSTKKEYSEYGKYCLSNCGFCKSLGIDKKIVECFNHYRCCVCGGFEPKDTNFPKKDVCKCMKPVFTGGSTIVYECVFCKEPTTRYGLPCSDYCERKSFCPKCRRQRILRKNKSGSYECKGDCSSRVPPLCKYFKKGVSNSCTNYFCKFTHSSEEIKKSIKNQFGEKKRSRAF